MFLRLLARLQCIRLQISVHGVILNGFERKTSWLAEHFPSSLQLYHNKRQISKEVESVYYCIHQSIENNNEPGRKKAQGIYKANLYKCITRQLIFGACCGQLWPALSSTGLSAVVAWVEARLVGEDYYWCSVFWTIFQSARIYIHWYTIRKVLDVIRGQAIQPIRFRDFKCKSVW